MLTSDDHARIEAAVAEAEAGSSGDIFCVLSGEVSSYREVPIAWGAALALLVPPIVLAFRLRYLLAVFSGGWTAAQASAVEPQIALVLSGYAVSQIVLFAVVTLIVSLGPVRRRLTPRFLKRHRVKRAAFHHFTAAHSHARDSETGILIFVALVDRQVEILADAAIHAKVGNDLWRKAAAAIQAGMKTPDPTAGIIEAIRLCGDALQTHFPSSEAGRGIDKPMEV